MIQIFTSSIKYTLDSVCICEGVWCLIPDIIWHRFYPNCSHVSFTPCFILQGGSSMAPCLSWQSTSLGLVDNYHVLCHVNTLVFLDPSCYSIWGSSPFPFVIFLYPVYLFNLEFQLIRIVHSGCILISVFYNNMLQAQIWLYACAYGSLSFCRLLRLSCFLNEIPFNSTWLVFCTVEYNWSACRSFLTTIFI
jgi:hypothetical protein